MTEVQIFIIIMYLLAAIGGSSLWQSMVNVSLIPILLNNGALNIAVLLWVLNYMVTDLQKPRAAMGGIIFVCLFCCYNMRTVDIQTWFCSEN